jgi:hypothetical protein
LLDSRIRLVLSNELLACRYQVGRCNLIANVLGEIYSYPLRTLQSAIVAWCPHEQKHEYGCCHKQDPADSKNGAPIHVVSDVCAPLP